MKFLYITKKEEVLLHLFLSKTIRGLEKFRYFNSRSFDVLDNHVATLLLMDNDTPVAYGHLDLENGRTWLGIAVADDELGKGLGKKMLKKLLIVAEEKKVNSIFLSVDKDNAVAIKLYEKFGFQLDDTKDNHYLYKWNVAI